MKKAILIYMWLVGSLFICTVQYYVQAVEGDPPYAKWGQIAMSETKAKYPNADIIDYLHIGRETGANTSIEKFKLWLREDNKEFGVFVNITFDNETEEMTDITFQETER